MNATRLRVAIVDDEPDARERLATLLVAHTDVDVVAQCRDGVEAAEVLGALLQGDGLDLVFLDVQMPELDGFMVLEALADLVGADGLPAVVFVTAYDDYALRAFDVSAVDFLLKPFDAARFERALARGRATSRTREGGAGVHALLAHLRNAATAPNGAYAKRLAVRADGKVYLVRTEDVEWIDVDGNYVRLHTRAGMHPMRETLAALEARLDPELFVRIHRSAIVHIDRIGSMEPYFHGEYVVTMRDGTKLTASRSYADRLRALFN
ncbi:MAG: LytTr DNA-binding region [Gemmatimonadetes bacterium]|nr:LytTr DNA-binding region [Gemmatimonadota bacterium]